MRNAGVFWCHQVMSPDSSWHSKEKQNQVAGLKNVLQEKLYCFRKLFGGTVCYVVLSTISQFNKRNI